MLGRVGDGRTRGRRREEEHRNVEARMMMRRLSMQSLMQLVLSQASWQSW